MKIRLLSGHKQTVWGDCLRILVLLVVAGISAVDVSAQTAKQPTTPPDPPYVAETAPGLSRWSIEFQYAGKIGDEWLRPTAQVIQGKRLLRLDVTKNGKVRLERGTYEGDLSMEKWVKGTYMVLRDPSYVHKIVRRNIEAGDFPEFKWITEDHYKGKEAFNGKACHVYRQEAYALQFADPGLYAAEMAQEVKSIDMGPKIPILAFVDAERKLPVKLQIGADARVYTFLAPPKGDLLIPLEYASVIDDVEGRYKALTKPLSKP